MSQPSASDVHTPGSGSKSSSGFKCVSCGSKMENWRNGYHCSDCKVAKHSSHDQKAHGRRGGTIDSDGPAPARRKGSTANDGPRTIDNDPPKAKKKGGTIDSDGPTPKRRKGSTTNGGPRTIDNDGDDSKAKGGDSKLPDMAFGSKPDPEKRRAATAATGRRNFFKCASCSDPMEHWRDGSVCESCVIIKAAATTAKKPAAGGGVGPAGKVQEEFPACPTCGAPTPDGAKCEDCSAAGAQERMLGDLNIAQTHAGFQGTLADMEEENERREIRRRARQRMARLLGLDEDEVAKAAEKIASLPPMVLKAAAEQRFSYAPMYMPGKLDAHGEFVKSADELQKAAWSYVEKTASDRTVYLQHIAKAAGKWVEITSWPYAVEAPMMVGDEIRKATLPAGTVYMGVIWEPWAWEMVKKGKLLGFSMGGWAKRVEGQLADESVTKDAGNGEPWTSDGVVNPDSAARFADKEPYDSEATLRALGLR